MYGQILDRFLKRFYGNRLHRHRTNSAGEEMTSPENEGKHPSAEKLNEPGCSEMEDRLEEAPLKTNKTKENGPG